MRSIIGQVLLNRFRVDQFIEATRTSAVYRVWDLQRNVPIAMKVLQSELAEDPKVIKIFQREAQALQQLTHPHIVPFFGLYQSQELTFLVELYIDGATLKSILRQRKGQPLPVEQAMVYLKALCAALGYAHRNGVVHCDLKPGNVMVDQGGQIYLTDFGVARHAESTTTTLGIVGTAAYMAPEQIRGEPVSAETDIYALGVMLYEMLTGQRPFASVESDSESGGSSTAERVQMAHLTMMPPNPLEINPRLPEGLASVIMIALNKDRRQRFHSTDEMLQAACAAIGVTPEQIPSRVTLPPELLAEHIPATQRAASSAPTAYAGAPASPVAASPSYSTYAAPPSKSIPWLWIGGGIGLIGALCVLGVLLATVLGGGGLFGFGASTPTASPTITPGVIDLGGQLARPTPSPTFTLEPPTEVVLPTDTPIPTAPPAPTDTRRPTDTQPPSSAGLKIRIRNRTSGAINLYRIGQAGERHFLGYLLAPGYYGEYPWPGFGPWTIEFCTRDASGNDRTCRTKQIVVESNLQEFTVP